MSNLKQIEVAILLLPSNAFEQFRPWLFNLDNKSYDTQIEQDIEKRTAEECYELLKVDPSHPPLHFKKLDKKYRSVQAGLSYWALGVEVGNGIS